MRMAGSPVALLVEAMLPEEVRVACAHSVSRAVPSAMLSHTGPKLSL